MAYNTVSVENTATLIVAANAQRQTLTIVNTEDGKIVFIGPDNQITIANAIPLYETQTRDSDKDFGFWLGDVYGIVATGTANVRYWEVTR